MGIQLICDSCHKPVLSVIPIVTQQNPTAISGGICIICLREKMDRLPDPEPEKA
jgi:hypothetical protein